MLVDSMIQLVFHGYAYFAVSMCFVEHNIHYVIYEDITIVQEQSHIFLTGEVTSLNR